MSEYPQHEKLATVKDMSQAIGEMLEWAEEQGWHLAEWDDDGWGNQRLHYIGLNTNQILARYFEINLDKLEAEKVLMLAEQRVSNETVKKAAEELIEQYGDTLKDLKDQ